jgi:hypothetical protein
MAGVALVATADFAHGNEAPTVRYVLSYLVCVNSDSNSYVPLEGVPSNLQQGEPWEWRVFDPATGAERLFLRLNSFPMGIRWDPTFAKVQFLSGRSIMQAPWKFGARAESLGVLPPDSSYCEFWEDVQGRLHVATQEERSQLMADGRRYAIYVGRRWDESSPRGTWRVAVVDSQAGGHYGECYVTPKLRQGAPQLATVELEDRLNRMSLDPDKAIRIKRDPGAPREADDWLWIPSETDGTIGLEMGGAMGDSYHALEPVIWVDRAHGKRVVVYPVGASGNQSLGQIGIEEWEGKALIVSEYEGGYPTIVDMRTGRTLFRVDRLSARAALIPSPR